MNTRLPEADGSIPVMCRVCHTRSYATVDQIGQELICPDCHARNTVKAITPSTSSPVRPTYTGDEYRLAEDQPKSPQTPVELIKVVCGTCYTLMHARAEHAGKRVKCPDCGTISVVPRPPTKKTAFRAPDASDVVIEAGPPPMVDEKRKEIADQLMANAADEVRQRDRERPVPPKDPLRNGIYTFPFYANVIPLWIGASVAMLLDFALFETLVDVITTGGFSSIMAAFLAPILAIFTFCILGMMAPHFLTIIEFTAEGYDRIPYWPSQDLLSRGHAMLFGINALAMSTMPGMLLVTPFRSLGVPLQLGLISTVLLLPLIVLSMAENDSVFMPYSEFVFTSVRRHYEHWSRFYIQVVLLTCALVAIDFLVWSAMGLINMRAPGIAAKLTAASITRTYVARTITVVGVVLFGVIYCRLIGRMAWILGQEDLEPLDNELEEQEEVGVHAASDAPVNDDAPPAP